MKVPFVKYIIVVGLLIFLVACGKAQDKENLFEIEDRNDIAATETVITETEVINSSETSEPTEQAEASLDFEIDSMYQYGNMQKSLPSGNFADIGEQVVFHHYNGQNTRLYQIDKQTLEVLPMCNDATCLHNSTSCKSYQANCNLEQYQGELYAQKNAKVAKYNGMDFEVILPEAVQSFFHAKGKLFVKTADGALMVVDEAGEEQMLIEEFDGHWCTVFGDYLYGNTWNDVFRVNLNSSKLDREILAINPNGMATDGKHLYCFDKNWNVIRRDMDGRNERVLINDSVPPAGFAFDEQNIYFRCLAGPDSYMEEGDCYSLYKMDKESLESVKIAELPYCIMGIYTACDYDRIFVNCQDRSVSSDEYAQYKNYYYAVSIDGTGYEELVLPNY